MKWQKEFAQQFAQGERVTLPCGSTVWNRPGLYTDTVVDLLVDGDHEAIASEDLAPDASLDLTTLQVTLAKRSLGPLAEAFTALAAKHAPTLPCETCGTPTRDDSPSADETGGRPTCWRCWRVQWFRERRHMVTSEERERVRQEICDRLAHDGESLYEDHDIDSQLPTVMPADLRVQVTVYAVSRHYGGPEEGGWWYNWYECTGFSERVYPDQMDAARKRLLEMFAADQPEHNIYSMANEGAQYEALTEDRVGEHQSKERPTYA